MITTFQAVLAFLEAFLTVQTAGLGGVMLHNNSVYTWPGWPAVVFTSLVAGLAGIRRLNALYKTP